MTVEKHERTALAIGDDQYEFTPMQVTALEHMGIQDASEGDLAVFFHQCKARGLDPFVKQIHMIGRNERDDNTESGWRVKWTIQTGIDGFRLIARRAARDSRDTLSVSAPEWKRRDTGEWVDAWDRQWGLPLAARITVHRAGQAFPAVALFDEYKQLKRNGHLTHTWDQRPAGQLAKCAEALALRMAFPEDLSGLYIDEEMDHADGADVTQTQPSAPATQVTAEHIVNGGGQAAAPAPDSGSGVPDADDRGDPSGGPAPDPDPPAVPMITDEQSREIGQLLQQIGITDRKDAVDYLNDCLEDGRTVRARKDLTRAEADAVLLSLRDDAAKALAEQAGEGAAAAAQRDVQDTPLEGVSQ